MPDAETILRQVPGLTYRKLDLWTTRGHLHADQRTQATSGVKRHWPWAEVRVARVMAQLTGQGFTPALAERIARSLGETVEIGPGITVRVDVADHETADQAEATDA